MADYKIVKYCKLCKTRFVVPKEEARRLNCSDCEKRLEKLQDEEME